LKPWFINTLRFRKLLDDLLGHYDSKTP
jgi:hypothetical protein